MTETATLTLTDFLLARIAEDEVGEGNLPSFGPCYDCGGFDPERWKAEREAKRRIVAEHRVDEDYLDWSCCSTCTAWDQQEPYEPPPTITWPCPTLRALALPYADHEDWREEWRL